MTTYSVSSFPGVSHSFVAIPAAIQDELWMGEQYREAINCLERAFLAPPLKLSREVDAAAHILRRLRARIVDWLRQDSENLDTGHWQNELSRLDAALELLNGVHYPGTRSRRKLIEQARQHLQSILIDGLF